jgi:hypothetical protein
MAADINSVDANEAAVIVSVNGGQQYKLGYLNKETVCIMVPASSVKEVHAEAKQILKAPNLVGQARGQVISIVQDGQALSGSLYQSSRQGRK